MPASASRSKRNRGFTLLEMMVAIALLAIVLVLFLGTWNESVQAGTLVTVKAELQAKGQAALNRLVNDMRSTQTGVGAVSLAPVNATSSVNPGGLSNSFQVISFYPIIGVATTTTAQQVPGQWPIFYTTFPTAYYWDPGSTTNPDRFRSNWQLSQIMLTTYDVASLKPTGTIALVNEVTGFSVTANSPSNAVGTYFSSTQPQSFQVMIQLSRKGGFGSADAPQGTLNPLDIASPQTPKDQPYLKAFGAVTVTLTTNVTIPPASP